jgi:hypothetical protein
VSLPSKFAVQTDWAQARSSATTLVLAKVPAVLRKNEISPSTQIDVGTVSKFIRNQTASAVRIDALWFERAEAAN